MAGDSPSSAITSGAKQRTYAIVPSDGLPNSFLKASPRQATCTSFIAIFYLKPLPQPFHRLGVVYANEKAKVTQPPLKEVAVLP
jgi:hypothetical protein